MPTFTTLHQDSTTYLDANGLVKFRVASSITYVKPGDLPQADIFVHQIVVALDPKQDKFLRVADIHDLTTLLLGRENALLNAQTTYMVPTFQAEFNDVTTAVAAKAVVQTRIDTLIANWLKYSLKFIIPTDFDLPAPLDNLVLAAKAAYTAAAALSTTKDATLVTANAALTEANAAASRAGTAYADALAGTINCQQQQANMSSLVSTYTSPLGYRTVMNALVAAAVAAGWQVGGTPGTSGNAGFNAALAAARVAMAAEATTVTPLLTSVAATMAAECAAEAANVTATGAAKTTADAAAATAQTTQTVAQAAATAAAAAEAAALAAVLAVCPDFVP